MDLPKIPKDGHLTQNTQQNEFLKEIYHGEERSRARLSTKSFQTARNPILAEETPRRKEENREPIAKTNTSNMNKFSFTKTTPMGTTTATRNFGEKNSTCKSTSNDFNSLKSKIDRQEHELRSEVSTAMNESESVDTEVANLCARRREITSQLQVIGKLLNDDDTGGAANENAVAGERMPYNESTWRQ